MMEQTLEMAEAMENMDKDDISGIFSVMFDMIDVMMKKLAVPNAIFTSLVSLGIVYGGNALIKHDPNENQYGSADIGNTFN